MDHKTHVGFVDAHAKGDGRHHNLQVVALEFLLHVGTDVILQPRMVRRSANPRLCRRAAVSSTFARLLQ